MTFSFLEVMERIDHAEDVNFLRELGNFLEEEKKEYSLIQLRTIAFYLKEKSTCLIQEKARQFVASLKLDDGLTTCPNCGKTTCRYGTTCFHCDGQI